MKKKYFLIVFIAGTLFYCTLQQQPQSNPNELHLSNVRRTDSKMETVQQTENGDNPSQGDEDIFTTPKLTEQGSWSLALFGMGGLLYYTILRWFAAPHEIEDINRRQEEFVESMHRAELAHHAEEVRQAQLARQAAQARQFAQTVQAQQIAQTNQAAQMTQSYQQSLHARQAQEAMQAAHAREAQQAMQAAKAKQAQQAMQAAQARQAQLAMHSMHAQQQAVQARQAAMARQAQTAFLMRGAH